MNRQSIFDDIQAKMSSLLKDSPAADIERNVKEVMAQGFRKMDLVTREEFELQRELLQKTREKVEELEKQLAALRKV
jgi:ubiquinone biosynthesis accessory factor UbiK